MAGEINGLYPTAARRSLLRAVDQGHGRIYAEAGQVWDVSTAWKVTDRMKQLVAHKWVRALAPDEPRGAGRDAQGQDVLPAHRVGPDRTQQEVR